MQLKQRGTLTHPFHCDLRTLGCKARKQSINKEKEKSPGTLSYTAPANRTGIDGKDSNGTLDVAVPMRSARTDLQSQHITQEPEPFERP